MLELYPSLLAADPLNLEREIKSLDAHCAGFHIDIMDGHFVPNLGFSTATANSIDAASTHPSWVHLMVTDPLLWLTRLTIKPKSMVSIHLESKKEIGELIKYIVEKKWLASIAISPKTTVQEILPYLDATIANVLIMSVEPGFYGQELLLETLEKIPELIAHKHQHNLPFSIGIDGGITLTAAHKAHTLGAQQVAIGSAIFQQANRLNGLASFKSL